MSDAQSSAGTLSVALRLAVAFGAALHLVSAHGARQEPSEAESLLASASQAARAEGLDAVTHVRRGDPAEALVEVAEQHDAQLLVVGSGDSSGASRLRLSSVPNQVSHHAPCSVLIARSGD